MLVLSRRLEGSTRRLLPIVAGTVVSLPHSAEEPVTAGSAGLRVVEILQAASLSIAQRGRPIELRSTTLQATA